VTMAAISIPLSSRVGVGEDKRSEMRQLDVSACLVEVREAAHDYTTTAFQVVEQTPARDLSRFPLPLISSTESPQKYNSGEKFGLHCRYNVLG